jgi:hypothetical protein
MQKTKETKQSRDYEKQKSIAGMFIESHFAMAKKRRISLYGRKRSQILKRRKIMILTLIVLFAFAFFGILKEFFF